MNFRKEFLSRYRLRFRKNLQQEPIFVCIGVELWCHETRLSQGLLNAWRLVLVTGACIFFLAFLFLSRAWCNDSPVVFNEIFVDGTSNYPDWIELYNTGDNPISLKGYALTDKLEEPKWVVKDEIILHSGEYKVFYCDGLQRYDHTGFGLDSIAGEVGLYSPDGELIDSVTYEGLPRFFSLGRWPDGAGDWFIHASPTKGSANPVGVSPMRHTQMVPVSFSRPSGRYDSGFVLDLAVPKGFKVHFTTDGSLPGAESSLYSSPIPVFKTTVIRAAAVSAEGKIFASFTRSYIVGEHTLLPVVSVVTDPRNLWDQEIGIYAEGTSNKRGVSHSQNWRNNWRRPVHLDFFDEAGNWDVDGQVRIFGGASRGRRQKSLAIYTTSKVYPYGIRHQLFPGIPRDSYAGIILRNGGDAWLRSQFRDAFQQALVQGRVACDTQPYRPVVAYLNGEYWGIYGLRELMIRKNLLARHNLPVQGIHLMDGGHEVASAKGPFANMPAIPAHGDYRPAMGDLNLDAFLDYLIVELYAGNPDWPDGNIKCWRPKSGTMKWQWVLFDLDRGFSGKRGKSVDENPFSVLLQRPGGRGLMFGLLTKNRQFVRDFCVRMVVHILTSFNPDRALKILDRMAGDIRPEMQRHIDRWRWGWKLERLFMSLDRWERNVDQLREFCRKRPQAMLDILDKQFGVGKPVDICINVTTQGRGRIFAEGIPLDDGRLEGPVPVSLDIVLSVEPAPGFVFKGWAAHPESGTRVCVKPGQTFKDCAIFETIDSHREKQ